MNDYSIFCNENRTFLCSVEKQDSCFCFVWSPSVYFALKLDLISAQNLLVCELKNDNCYSVVKINN
jgi:hypothetical protein